MLLCGGGGDSGADPNELSAEEKKRNDAIAKTAAKNDQDNARVIKMLLLGAGESGKSTIFKQMKVINKDGYTEKERKEFVGIVHSNAIASMRSLMQAFEQLEVDMPADLGVLDKKFSDATEGNEKLTPGLSEVLQSMWQHDAMKAMFLRRNEFQLNDSTRYFLDDIERLCATDYVPTQQDVLCSRVRTTGIVQSDFQIKGLKFALYDVGGQRNERRKWIHCFDDVQTVIFVASCSEFDQKLFEDESQNRLDEAIQLFDQICNSKWFRVTSMILFLNKRDLFTEKLKEKQFADYISGYTGPNEEKECTAHMKNMFLEKNKCDKNVFVQITCATDTGNMKFVFNAVIAIILENNMKASGLA